MSNLSEKKKGMRGARTVAVMMDVAVIAKLPLTFFNFSLSGLIFSYTGVRDIGGDISHIRKACADKT